MIGVETFIADWESIMESLPRTVIGTYVTFTYLDEPSRFEDNMAIYVSLAISGAKLCYTVLKILISGGHQAGKEGWWRDDDDQYLLRRKRCMRGTIIGGHKQRRKPL